VTFSSRSAVSYHRGVSTSEDRAELHVIDVFVMSVKCGNCDNYQTIVGFRKLPEKNVYTYECENDVCDPNVTRTIVEVPKHLDNSTKRAEELPYYTAEEDPEKPGV
jgi:ribosomal protein S27E